MATSTTHFKLIKPEGNDLFNPLSLENPNWDKIDAAMWANEITGVQTATELKSGTVHAITVPNEDGAMFRFVATSNWTAGDTCTVNGAQVSALLPNGQTLPDGAFVINSNVLCCLVGTLLTLFVGGGGASGDVDAATLEGHPASYFGTAIDVAAANNNAVAAQQLANKAQGDATNALNKLSPLTESIDTITVVSSLPSNPSLRTLYLIPET